MAIGLGDAQRLNVFGRSHRHPDPKATPESETREWSCEVTGLCKSFGGRVVLDRVDIGFEKGEFVALLGASGSGKSTLLRVLAGLDTEIDGEVRTPDRRAVVFQEHRLLPWKRVLDNVVLGLSGSEARNSGRQILDEVGLSARADAWPGTLSGGESQRVALARALVREPDLLLLDEPFGALDALTRIRMHELVLELWGRHRPAVLLVTHDVDEAIVLADRILLLSEGRIGASFPLSHARPRRRSDPALDELRQDILEQLGVLA